MDQLTKVSHASPVPAAAFVSGDDETESFPKPIPDSSGKVHYQLAPVDKSTNLVPVLTHSLDLAFSKFVGASKGQKSVDLEAGREEFFSEVDEFCPQLFEAVANYDKLLPGCQMPVSQLVRERAARRPGGYITYEDRRTRRQMNWHPDKQEEYPNEWISQFHKLRDGPFFT
jgi:hypothetical protein